MRNQAHALPVDHANIPEMLKRLNLWVVWAYVWKDGRWTKMPFQPVKASQKYRDKTGWVSLRRQIQRPEHVVGL